MKTLEFVVPDRQIHLKFRVDENLKQAVITGPNGCGKSTLLQVIRREHNAGPALDIYSIAERKSITTLYAHGSLVSVFARTDYLLPGKFSLTSPMDLRDFIWLHWGVPVRSLDFVDGEVREVEVSPQRAVEILRMRRKTDIYAKAIEAVGQLSAAELPMLPQFDALRGQLVAALRARSSEAEQEAERLKDLRDVLNIKIRAAADQVGPEIDRHLRAVGCERPPFKSLTELEKPAYTFSQGQLTHLRLQLLAAAALRKDGTVTVLLDDQDTLGLDSTKTVNWPDNVFLLTVGPGDCQLMEVIK